MANASTAGEAGGINCLRVTTGGPNGPLNCGQTRQTDSQGGEVSEALPVVEGVKVGEVSRAVGRGHRFPKATTACAVRLRRVSRVEVVRDPVSHRSDAALARVFKGRRGVLSKRATYLLLL